MSPFELDTNPKCQFFSGGREVLDLSLGPGQAHYLKCDLAKIKVQIPQIIDIYSGTLNSWKWSVCYHCWQRSFTQSIAWPHKKRRVNWLVFELQSLKINQLFPKLYRMGSIVPNTVPQYSQIFQLLRSSHSNIWNQIYKGMMQILKHLGRLGAYPPLKPSRK